MKLEPGSVYMCRYMRWHNDPNPLVFILYAGDDYTHALNLHYIKREEYEKLAKMFAEIQKKKRLSKMFFQDKPAFYYNYLKPHFKEFIDVSYRTYFTPLLAGIVAHPMMLSQIGSKWRERFNFPKTPAFEKLSKRIETDVSVKELKALMLTHGHKSPTMNTIKDFMKEITDAYTKDIFKTY